MTLSLRATEPGAPPPGGPRRRRPGRRAAGAALVAALLLAGGTAPVLAAPSPAPAADAAAALTVTPNPGYRAAEPFEGWGTSLVWFAHATGGYPDEVREDLYQKVFGADGLNLNIARYNVGGGNATDVDSAAYMRQGGDVPGWWRADLDGDGDTDEATRANADAYRAAWDPDDDASYDLDADAGQRWWVERLVADQRITHWEAFSNSPPWFMTPNGYATGGFSATTDQLRADSVDDFAGYMTRVVEHLEDTYGIDVATIDPMNEPNTSYWSTTLGADGSPTCCRQEGAHMGPALQARVVEALQARLQDPATTTDAVISAPDETNPGTFVADWKGWSAAARAAVGQLNVHTYGTAGRVQARDVAKASGKPLWMSEVEGDFSGVDGFDPTNIDNGLGMAAHIVDDLRELEPTAWVFWQPVEDLWNMQVTETANWGSVFVDFDCDAEGRSARRVAAGEADPSCQVLTNAKYNTVRNFTHYIRPGDFAVPTDDAATTAFVDGDGEGATLVHVNSSAQDQAVTLDLSRFADRAGATVTPVVTTAPTAADVEANALVEGRPVAVDPATGTATLTVPAKSVTTFVVDGVSGVAAGAVPADDTPYLLRGEGSGRLLTGHAAAPATIEDLGATPQATARQTWRLRTLAGAGTQRRTVAVTDGTGAYLAAGPGNTTTLVASDPATAARTPAQQWILTTTDGATWSLLSVAATAQLDVSGEGSAAGTAVGTWAASTGAHQAWTFRSTRLTAVAPVQAQTPVGTAPELPGTVEPRYGWGSGTPVPVTWSPPGADAWGRAGTVTVTGRGTDAFGAAFEAAATVDVGDFATTDPVAAHTYVGASDDLLRGLAPTTVPAHVGTSPRTSPAPVAWDWAAVADATARPGVVTVPGTATTRSGTLPARLSVVVTEPVAANVATAPTTRASATYTESGYPVDRTRNGVRDDKGWSNWRSGTNNASDTLTYDLGGEQTLSAARVYFWADGTWPSWAARYTAQYRTPQGTWVSTTDAPVAVEAPAGGGAPTVEVDLAGVRTDAVRFVLEATERDGVPVHLVVSEVEIDALGPQPSAVADLAALRVAGRDVDGFASRRGGYQVQVPRGTEAVVSAVPVDDQATVTVEQPDGNRPAKVRVTSPDGSATRTWTVVVRQQGR